MRHGEIYVCIREIGFQTNFAASETQSTELQPVKARLGAFSFSLARSSFEFTGVPACFRGRDHSCSNAAVLARGPQLAAGPSRSRSPP
jgi:hypothetical protein